MKIRKEKNQEICSCKFTVEGDIGYIHCCKHGDEAEITDLFVDPAYRERGIGRQLMEEVIFCNKEMRTHHIVLHVASDNYTALHLYKSLGFKSQCEEHHMILE